MYQLLRLALVLEQESIPFRTKGKSQRPRRHEGIILYFIESQVAVKFRVFDYYELVKYFWRPDHAHSDPTFLLTGMKVGSLCAWSSL